MNDKIVDALTVSDIEQLLCYRDVVSPYRLMAIFTSANIGAIP